MTELFARQEALQDELPATPYTDMPLTAPQFEALEKPDIPDGPQIDDTLAWSSG